MVSTDHGAEALAVSLQSRIGLAHRLADAAGEIQRRYFRTAVAVDSKADQSPVTIADREAEAAMRAILAREAPDHGIFGEEAGAHRTDARHVWVLDPIDGTKAFITGRPTFGTLIALLEDGVPVLGLIDQAIIGERWLGLAGEPSTLGNMPISTRACPSLGQAVVLSTSPDMFERGPERDAYDAVSTQTGLRLFGGDCYAYAQLAMGFVDLVIEADLAPYDYLAVVPVIEGAGGIVTDWQGNRLTLESDGRVLAAGDRRCHDAALAILSAA